MSSRIKRPGKCYKCGWEYPATYGSNICKFCGGSVYRNVGPEPGYCKDCGAYCDNIHRFHDNRCSKCHSKVLMKWQRSSAEYKEQQKVYARQYMHKRSNNADKKYADWIEQLNSVNTHTLTEEEWLQACRHFGGCAMCGAESIDTRMYFIQHTEGGKYNACNIIPACEKCANDYKVNPNPFRTMDKLLNGSAGIYRGQSRERLQDIVGYLQSKIEEVNNASARKD